MITHPAYGVEPWTLRESELHLDVLPQSESVFALVQRPRRLARQPRRGRTARPARLLPQRRARAAPAAVRGGGLRLSGVRADGHQRHQRQAHPAARRRRALRPALRHGCARTSGCWTCAPGCCTGTCEWTSPAGSHGPGALHPAGLLHPAGDRRRRLRGGAGGQPDAGGRAVRTGRQRAAARPRRATRGPPSRWSRRWRPRSTSPRGTPAAPGAPHPAQRAAGRRGGRPRGRRARTRPP